jgi:hypothetical protein
VGLCEYIVFQLLCTFRTCMYIYMLLYYLQLSFFCFFGLVLYIHINTDSSFVPPIVYAVLGSSRDLAVGPVSIASLVLGSMLMQEVSPNKDPLLFLQLAFTSTFFAGLFQASLGFLRSFLSFFPFLNPQYYTLKTHLIYMF